MKKTKEQKNNIFSRAATAISDFFYNISVRLHQKFNKKPKKQREYKSDAERRKDLIFVLAMLALPILCFCVFYVGVNFNSVLLAFKKYSIENTADGIVASYDWVGLYNIKEFFKIYFTGEKVVVIKNSLIIYLFGLVFGLPLALFFSYYIYKKRACSGLFSVILYLPSIVSGIVMTILFQYFTERAVPAMVSELWGIDRFNLFGDGIDGKWRMIVFFNVWVSFGLSVIMYSNAMSGIPVDVCEAAQIDGVTSLGEFFYVTLPLIYPTVSTFLVTGVAGIFINQANIQGFYGTGNSAVPEIRTIGYDIFQSIMADSTDYAQYPSAAAAGVVLTVIASPIVMFVRWALEKFGPNTEY